jgi:hypothetical protein
MDPWSTGQKAQDEMSPQSIIAFPNLEFKSIISMASELLKTKSFNVPVGAVRREAFSRRLVL